MGPADTATVRDELAGELDRLLPGVLVLPYGVELDDVTQPVAMVVLDRVVRPEGMPVGTRRHELTVWLVEATKTPGVADDLLDARLDGFLQLVDEELPAHDWTSVERGVYRETHPAYRVGITRED